MAAWYDEYNWISAKKPLPKGLQGTKPISNSSNTGMISFSGSR